MAFKINSEDVEDVKKHLDHREKGGYTKCSVTFHPDDTSEPVKDIELYIGMEDNPNYLGPAPLNDIATQIYRSVGPSGKNIDYLYNLAEALRTLSPGREDSHVAELEQMVREIQRNDTGLQR